MGENRPVQLRRNRQSISAATHVYPSTVDQAEVPNEHEPYTYWTQTTLWLEPQRWSHITSIMSNDKIEHFLREAIDSLIPTPKFDKTYFAQVLKNCADPRVIDILVDVLETLDTFIYTESSPHHALFIDLVIFLINNDVLPLESIAERFSANTISTLKFTPGVDFAKRYRVQRTNLLYKQKKFNLIREESEGYSKLIVEISNTSGSPSLVIDRIKSLIGYFDLSPARVLDVLFDVYSSNLLEGYTFFCELCKLSPWWPESVTSKWKDMSNNERIEALAAGITPQLISVGSSDRASQIMGFKFQSYHDSDDETPMRLSLLSAILIKEGMIDLKIIYQHLLPNHSTFLEIYQSWKKEMAQKVAKSKSNALSMAAPLTDESTPSQNVAPTPQPIVRSQKNQKIPLLKALLAVGALPESLFILSQYPWLPSFDPEIADLINKLVNYMIEPLYSTVRPLNGIDIFAAKKRPADKKAGELVLVEPAKPIGYRISNPLPKDPNERFFYREWDEEIPIIHTFDQFHRVIIPLLRFPGCLISRDVLLLHKLVRLGINEVSKSRDQMSVWQDYLRIFLLPGLSLLATHNTGVTNLIWELLAKFPYNVRFSIYGGWTCSYKSIPELKVQFTQTEKESKGILKRLSKETMRQTSRTFPRLIHSNPIVVFGVILGQIQAYDNLSETVVEVARYLCPMGYDVFGYVLLSLLSTEDKRRLKDDGTNLGHWLQSLSSFAGKVYKRYPAMDVSLPLQYVVWQLKSGQTFDLVVLKEILINLSGVDSIVNLSDSQIEDVSGGPVLREVMLKDVFWKEKDRSRKSSARLAKVLDGSLGMEFVKLLPIARQSVVYQQSDRICIPKLLLNLFDECHEVMVLFADFIVNSLDWDRYCSLLPSLATFLGEWGVDPESAFCFLRPVMLERLKEWDTNETIRIQREALLKKRIESGVGEVEEGEDSNDVFIESKSDNPFHPALKPFFEDAETTLVGDFKELISPEFFILFWQLDISDIHVPLARYTAAKDKIASQIRNLDVPSHSVATMTSREKEDFTTKKSELNKQLQLLTDESKRLVRSFEKTRKRFNVERDYWFCSKLPGERIQVAENFLQHCIFPRAKFSPKDAIFSARFIKQLHALGTPNFPTLVIYDDIFNERFASIIPTFSQYEADNYGRFMAECLSELMFWHKDEALFNKEGRGKSLPGFYKRGLIRIDDNEPAEEKAKRLLTYEEFRAVMFKWSMKLEKSVKVCLASKEYMRIRNTLIILGKLAHVWPANDEHGDHVIAFMEQLLAEEKEDDTNEEKRQDIITRGDGCLGLLKKAKSRWIPREEFSLAKDTKKASESTERTSTELNPNAADFQPGLVQSCTASHPTNGINGAQIPAPPIDSRHTDDNEALRRPHEERKRDEDRRGRLINSREPSPRRPLRSESRNETRVDLRTRVEMGRLSRSMGNSPQEERTYVDGRDTERQPLKQQTSEELEASLRAQLKNKDSPKKDVPTLFKEPPSQPRSHNQARVPNGGRLPPSGPASTRNETLSQRGMGIGSTYRPETWHRDHPSSALVAKPGIETRMNGKEVYWEGKRDDRDKNQDPRSDRERNREDRERKEREFTKTEPNRTEVSSIKSRPPSRGDIHRTLHREEKREISRHLQQPRNRDFHHRNDENISRRESLVGISIRGTGAPRDERERRRDEDRRDDSRHETIIREPRREDRRHHRRRSKSPDRVRRKHEREDDRQGVSKRRKTDR